MHSTGSLLLTACERIRITLDEVSTDAKYDNDYLIRYLLLPIMIEVVSLVNQTSRAKFATRFDIVLVAQQEHYTLPPMTGEVLRFGKLDSSGFVTQDFKPRGDRDPSGVGWAVEGNRLAIRPFPMQAETYQLWVVSNGDVMAHLGSSSTWSSTSCTLAATPTLGDTDKRPNAYVGSVIRVLGSTIWEERVIMSYDPVTRVVVWNQALTSTPGGATVYEVVPQGFTMLWESIAMRTALRLGLKKLTQAERAALKEEASSALKALRDHLGSIEARNAGQYQVRTEENEEMFRAF